MNETAKVSPEESAWLNSASQNMAEVIEAEHVARLAMVQPEHVYGKSPVEPFPTEHTHTGHGGRIIPVDLIPWAESTNVTTAPAGHPITLD